MNLAYFLRCSTARNGGRMLITGTCKFKFTDITFEDCHAVSGYYYYFLIIVLGGAIYTEIPDISSSLCYLARCHFIENVASSNELGNDIKDLNAIPLMWSCFLLLYFILFLLYFFIFFLSCKCN
jgi:hypothetical protein